MDRVCCTLERLNKLETRSLKRALFLATSQWIKREIKGRERRKQKKQNIRATDRRSGEKKNWGWKNWDSLSIHWSSWHVAHLKCITHFSSGALKKRKKNQIAQRERERDRWRWSSLEGNAGDGTEWAVVTGHWSLPGQKNNNTHPPLCRRCQYWSFLEGGRVCVKKNNL